MQFNKHASVSYTDSILFMQPPVTSHTSRQRPHVPPRHHIPTPAVTSHSSDITPPVPKPRTRSASPSRREASPKPIVTAGIRVLPPIPSTSSNPSPPQLPSYSSVPVVVMTTPTLPSYEAAISTQPPAKPQATAANTEQYTLPDPISSLSIKELEIAKQISSMGFPPPRVARATKRLKDSAKVRTILCYLT